jgi:hypothetical protein
MSITTFYLNHLEPKQIENNSEFIPYTKSNGQEIKKNIDFNEYTKLMSNIGIINEMFSNINLPLLNTASTALR